MSIYKDSYKVKQQIIYLDPKWTRELKRIAADSNVSLTEIVRRALRHFYKLDNI